MVDLHGSKTPEDAPQDEVWAHWKECRECWPHDWMWFGYGGCETGRALVVKAKNAAIDESAHTAPERA